jgi:hypothetical protein
MIALLLLYTLLVQPFPTKQIKKNNGHKPKQAQLIIRTSNITTQSNDTFPININNPPSKYCNKTGTNELCYYDLNNNTEMCITWFNNNICLTNTYNNTKTTQCYYDKIPEPSFLIWSLSFNVIMLFMIFCLILCK